jgi:transposase
VLLDAASLPDDVGLLKAMLVAADVELEQLRMQVRGFGAWRSVARPSA